MIRSSFHARSFGLLSIVVGAAAGPLLVNCTQEEAEEDTLSEDAVTGIDNPLGLGLRFDEATGSVQATLKDGLRDGERLFIRLRAGKITLDSQSQLKCTDLTLARPIGGGGNRELTGAVVYQGPKVDPAVFDLVHLFDDPGWATGDVSAEKKEQAKNPDPIVEACILKGSVVRAKLQTNLAYAWDQGTDAKEAIKTASLGLAALDAGVDSGSVLPQATNRRITESNVSSQIEYGQLCEKHLGENPLFPKISDGKYETFDCRDLVANGRDGRSPHAIPGVEGARIPVKVNGVEQTKCSPGRELGLNTESYGCMDKADHGMYLARGETQPGPMVVTAKNAQGTHWLLLCRKVADDGKGMMKTKVFNDMAMLGHNPRTGRTCFFQNSIGSGRDGSKVPHPGDREKSSAVWSASVQSYCTGSCHAADAFVHSAWIDGAKRANGTSIVPKMGELPDFPISNSGAPYNIVAADKLGFALPKMLLSDGEGATGAGACLNCHRLTQGSVMGDFTNWSTGTDETYFSRMTDLGKKFEESHWMPPNLDGLNAANFAASKYGQALKFVTACNSNPSDPKCEWGNIPRGRYNNPKVR